MNRARLPACGIDVCGNPLQHNDIVLFDDVDDLALDVGQAFPDQGRPDEPGLHGRELEPGELVRIRPGARPDADHLVQQVDGWNCDDALPMLSQRRERVIPFTGSDSEYRREIDHHGPGDGHDVVFTSRHGLSSEPQALIPTA